MMELTKCQYCGTREKFGVDKIFIPALWFLLSPSIMDYKECLHMWHGNLFYKKIKDKPTVLGCFLSIKMALT